MSRDSNGVYTLAAGNPVVVNDLIEAGWANATLDDLAVAMQDSLSRSGKGGMSAALKAFAGTLAAPGVTWADEVATGWYRAGAGDIRFGLAGVELLKFTANAATLAGAFNGKNGADIASATGAGTLNLTTATGNTVDVTGTTTQTAITLADGTQRLVRFTGILILTHGASLILPGAANITTAAGDYAIFQGYAAGVVRCVAYLRASGMAKAGANNDITSLLGLTTPIAIRSYLAGCVLSTAGSSATMSIAAGVAVNSTNTTAMVLAAIAKTTAAWAVGNAQGGLDTGTIANNTSYKFYVIQRVDTGVVDVIFTTAALDTGPAMPTGYTLFRYIGSRRTNGSAQWVSFLQIGDYVSLIAQVQDVSGAANTAVTLRTLSVPTGVKVRARFTVSVTADNAAWSYIVDPDVNGTAASGSAAASIYNQAADFSGLEMECFTNTSGQINTDSSGTNATISILTSGWTDTRGRDL